MLHVRLRALLPKGGTGRVLLVADPAWVPTSSNRCVRLCCIRRVLLRRDHTFGHLDCSAYLRQLVCSQNTNELTALMGRLGQ
jgi:hypothetical protein